MDALISVRTEDPHGVAATRLIRELSADLALRYADRGDDGSGSFRPEHAAGPRSAFVVATLEGRPVGCGALRPIDSDVVEIKRMYVVAAARRCGVGSRILRELERLAAEFGYGRINLETGIRQPEAIGLYERCGFHRIPPFGNYVGNPMSVCFEKRVADVVD